MRMVDRHAEGVVCSALGRIRSGRLVMHLPGGVRAFGPDEAPTACLDVHDTRFFRRVVAAGEIGLGESYMAGEWSSPDLVALARLLLANGDALGAAGSLAQWWGTLRDTLAHWRRDNTRPGSRRNIAAHYDLGNEFFRLFLDANLLYSCAYYEHEGDSLEVAQINKLQAIARKLDLRPGDRVLEIGSGWGGFALFAATRYGCHVTTTTISARQHAYVSALIDRAGDAGRRIDLRFDDYRDLSGRFDKIVSIEMFEAVGLRHYDDFFAACDRLLDRDGLMLLQTITVDDWRFADYRSAPNWISKYIFPGAELASLEQILASLARTTKLGPFHMEQIGTHYARTLHAWRGRFHARLADVRAQGFDERFIRMWDLYLGYCEAAFEGRHIGDVQLLLTKPANRRTLFGEPWGTAMQGVGPALRQAPARVSAAASANV